MVAPKRVDRNQPQIVADLRGVPGVSVCSLHTVGNDFPDIIVGFRGQNWLFEIKTQKGEAYSKCVSYPKGDPRNPLTDEELSDKFLRWTCPSITEECAYEIKQAIFEIDGLEDISQFTELLSR